MRKLSVVLTAVAAVTLSAAPLSAQWGDIFGRSSDRGVPRGMCRVWIDGVAANRQPRATDCRTAERERPYYEQRYGRRARVVYGERTNRNDRYDNRNSGAIILGKRNGDGTVYGDRNGTNCRNVERVIAGRVIRQRVCDNNRDVYGNGGVYDRNGRIYDQNGRVYDRNGRVYDRNGNVISRRDRRDDRWGRNDRDSDDDKGRRGRSRNRSNRDDD